MLDNGGDVWVIEASAKNGSMKQNGSNSIMTITHAIEQMAERHAERTAFSDDGCEVTFEKLDSVTRALSQYLKKKGAKGG